MSFIVPSISNRAASVSERVAGWRDPSASTILVQRDGPIYSNVLRIAGYLVLGVILTWVAAAACALWAPLSPRTSLGSQATTQEIIDAMAGMPATERYVRRLRDELGYWDITVDRWSGIGINVRQVRCDPVTDESPMSAMSAPVTPAEIRTGWPLRCFAAISAPETASFSGSVLKNGLPIESQWTRPLQSVRSLTAWIGVGNNAPSAIIPLMPIPAPLLGNIAFWAGIGFMVFSFPFWLRTLLRIARGQCARCRYPVRGLACCPECGPSPLPHTAT